MASLFQSRKFLTLLLDTVISLVLFAGGLYFPDKMDAVKQLILILQPVFLAVIAAIAHEEATLIRATGAPSRNA